MAEKILIPDLLSLTKKKKPVSSPQVSIPHVSYHKSTAEIPDYPSLIVFDKLNNKGKPNASITFRSISPIYFPKNFPGAIPPDRGECYLISLTQSEAFQTDFFTAFGYKKNNIQDLISKISGRIFSVVSYRTSNQRKIGRWFGSYLRDDERKARLKDNPDKRIFSLIPELSEKEASRLEKNLSFNLPFFPLDFFPNPDYLYSDHRIYKVNSYLSGKTINKVTHFSIDKARVYALEDDSHRLKSTGFVFLRINKAINKDASCLYSLPMEKKKEPENLVKVPAVIGRYDESTIKRAYEKYPNEKASLDLHVRSIISGLSKVIKACNKGNLEQRQLQICHIRDELRFVFYIVIKELSPDNRNKKYFKNCSSVTKWLSGRREFGDIFLRSRNRNKSRPGGTRYLTETIFIFDAFSHLFNDEYSEKNKIKIENFRNKSQAEKEAILYSFIVFFTNLNLTRDEKERLNEKLSVSHRLKEIGETKSD